MKLSEKQQKFTVMIAKLIMYADDMGYGLTFGDAYRDPRVSYGHADSLHRKRLAVDFNLFKDGEFLQSTEDHKLLGEYWESIGGSWGGRFKSNPDGNHYSTQWEGMK
jgi:hypothetical protein